MFDYKTNITVLDGLTLEEFNLLNASDFKAFNYEFVGDEIFDSDYYLAKNPDVADIGVNPFTHFMEVGVNEGRSPNLVVDVAKSADSFMVLPFAEGSSLDSYDFSLFKELSLTLESNNSVKVAGFPLLIPLVDPAVKTVIYIGVGLLTLESVRQANSIVELVNDNSSNIFWTPVDERLFDKGNINTFPGGSSLAIGDGTPPFDVGTVVEGYGDNTLFPTDNPILRQLLDGIYEFPLEVFELPFILEAGKFGNDLGLLREQKVADIVGGTLAKDINGKDIRLFEPGASSSVSIDVFGPNGELILVGGPNKADPAKRSKLGIALANLKIIANAKGVKAQHYFTDDTPQSIIDFTIERLGAENVFVFPEVNLEQP